MKSRIAVAGACGRMGRAIIKTITEQQDTEVALAVDVKDVGKDIGEIAGIGSMGVRVTSPENLGDKLRNSKTEILVDFTNPQAALKTAKIAAESGVSLVIGTTGLKKEELEVIERSVKGNHISAVISPNMATGVNVFFKLVKDAALSLGEGYDVEIVEVHHRHKKDAPSGTALRAGEVIAKALGRDLEKDGIFGRKGMVGERKTKEIGVHAVRAGDVVGDHTVLFAGEGERIEVIHRAHSRQAFVNGVIKAIRFLAGREGDGKVYSTWDVLGIR